LTICVCVTSATSFPSAPVTRVCHTCVVRPLWIGVASPVTVVPSAAAPMKLVLDSMVAVLAPGGMLTMVPIAPSVSAKAMIEPPCRTLPPVHRSARTLSVARTRSCVTSVSSMPSSSGSRPLNRSRICAARLTGAAP
jgi:hypothetical protein